MKNDLEYYIPVCAVVDFKLVVCPNDIKITVSINRQQNYSYFPLFNGSLRTIL